MAAGRRRALKAGVLALAWLAAGAHTPYRQWTVYRRKHLLLLAHRGDGATYAVARALAAVLVDRLPASKARVTRAPHLHRVASLLATDQLQFAVLHRRDAVTMRRGAPPLDAYGAVALAAIAGIGAHVLVARSDVPARHAWLIAEALDGATAAGTPVVLPAGEGAAAFEGLPVHPGAAAYARGEGVPDTGGEAPH